MNDLKTWDRRFMALLEEPKKWSLEGGSGADVGVAAVLVSPDRRQLSLGYAGFPRGLSDGEKHTCRDVPLLRDTYMRHAERNAISNAGCDLSGWTLYSSMPPCLECVLEAHAHRIGRIVAPRIDHKGRWAGKQLDGMDFATSHGMGYTCYEH